MRMNCPKCGSELYWTDEFMRNGKVDTFRWCNDCGHAEKVKDGERDAN
jgi:uncharacterized Zn finger protein